MLHKVTSPNCTYNVFFRVSTKFKTYFNSSSDLLCCNALPKALAPDEVTLQVESLQWEKFTEYEHTSHDLHDTKFSVSVATTLKLHACHLGIIAQATAKVIAQVTAISVLIIIQVVSLAMLASATALTFASMSSPMQAWQ